MTATVEQGGKVQPRQGNYRRRYHSDADRISLNIAVDPETRCWNWQQRIHRNGYGCFTIAGPTVDGTRTFTFWFDHLCRNRACCNPEHLEPVTPRENLRRSTSWTRPDLTHCKRGHPFDDANTGTQNGYRLCLACRRASQRTARERRMVRAAGVRQVTR